MPSLTIHKVYQTCVTSASLTDEKWCLYNCQDGSHGESWAIQFMFPAIANIPENRPFQSYSLPLLVCTV